ncbi:MAG: AI-2E family transporter [Sphingobacteriales bacterium]|nr:MAG: AI-2E family transporter [Sphingobacteriales bacterium]
MARNLQFSHQLLLMQPATVQNRVIQLLGLFLIGLLIYFGRDIIIPLGFSFVIAISLLPVYRLFKRFRLPDVLAIVLSILCGVIVIGAIVFILSLEFGSMLENKDALKANIDKHIEEIGLWIQDKTGMNLKAQQAFFKKQMDGAGNNAGGLLASTATTIGSYLVWFGLVPIYVFLILYYKNLLVRFIFLASKTEQHDLVEESIRDGESTIKNYLLGLLIEMLILAVLVTIVLTLFGIKYAILIGAIFAVLNMIPYLGALIANILAILITLSTSADIGDPGGHPVRRQ